jgi:thiosulfate/3-mercaptopyruvate sulfurtransferase
MSNPVASPLIGVDELGGLDKLDHRITILDVRYQLGGPSGRDEYARGHIPGAAYVDLDQDLADPPGAGGRHPLPEQGRFEAAMRRAGVSTDRPVVVYDDWAGRAAARAWWLLRYYGHEDVRVLDGGWSAWTGEVETGSPTVATGDFHGTPGQLKVLEAEDVLAFAAANVLIDARNPERYRGEVEPVDPVAGHIPGAINVPTGVNLAADGRFRTPEELRAVYAEATGEVATYCGSGVTAAHDILALASIGIDAALYPGSWSGWVTDESRPIATG